MTIGVKHVPRNGAQNCTTDDEASKLRNRKMDGLGPYLPRSEVCLERSERTLSIYTLN